MTPKPEQVAGLRARAIALTCDGKLDRHETAKLLTDIFAALDALDALDALAAYDTVLKKTVSVLIRAAKESGGTK